MFKKFSKKIRIINRALSILIVSILFFQLSTSLAFAADVKEIKSLDESFRTEEKIISKATLSDDFMDDCVIVTLRNDISKQLRAFDENDFKEVGVVSVEELTKYSTEAIKAQRKKDSEKVSIERKSEEKKSFQIDVDTESDFNRIDENMFNQILKLELKNKGKENILKAIRELEKRDDIICADPDHIDQLDANPDDPRIGDQWALNKINLPEAWNITTGNSTVLVGVIDSGISSVHEDFENRINISLSKDFIANSPLTDTGGHGTHVAGIIGARGNNNTGITGACWDVRLVSLKASDGEVNVSRRIAAIDYAQEKNIPILNNSSGGNRAANNSEMTAIQNYPGLFVCAAGNSGTSNNDNNHFPSNYSLSNLIAVGASTSSDAKRSTSNFGATKVHLFAPGESILSTSPTAIVSSGYSTASGTSMAAPFVTGAAALMLSVNPSLTTAKLKEYLLNSVDKVPALNGLCVSGGRLNVENAVNLARGFMNDEVVSGDFNNDGKADIATLVRVSASTMQIQVILTPTSGTAPGTPQVWWSTQSYNISNIKGRVAAGDFTGDGKCDIAAIYDTGLLTRIDVWRSSGSSFLKQTWISNMAYPASTMTGRVVAGNFDGDANRRADLAVMYDNGSHNFNLYVWKSTGSGFNSSSSWKYDAGYYDASAVTRRFVAGNFDGDSGGKADIAAMYNYGNHDFKFHVWKSSGTAFTGWHEWKYDAGYYDAPAVTGRLVSGDFDGDGKSDIAGMYDYGSHNFKLHVWKSTGTAFNGWHEWLYDAGWYDASAVTNRLMSGQFYGDSKTDLAARYYYSTTGKIATNLWRSTGSGFERVWTW